MTRPVAQLERCVVVRLMLHVVKVRVVNRSGSSTGMDGFRAVHAYALIRGRVGRGGVVLGYARVFHKVAGRREASGHLAWTVRRRYRHLGEIDTL